MASQDDHTHEVASELEEATISKTTSSSLHPPVLEVAGRSLSSQLGDAIGKPGSPLTPSPEGSAAIKEILQRLELMEMESRDLLSRLFSMVLTDARLQSYIRRRIQDRRLSNMWGLVEKILVAHQGSLDIDTMLESSDLDSSGYSSVPAEDKELKEVGTDVNERFKVRQFDKDNGAEFDEQPPADSQN